MKVARASVPGAALLVALVAGAARPAIAQRIYYRTVRGTLTAL